MTKKFNSKLIHYLRVVLEDGSNAWFILSLKDNIKIELLKKKLALGVGYDIRDYGDPIHAGYDIEASQEVLDHVNEKYGTSFSN